MTENDQIFYQAWLTDLQMTADSLREQREEDKKLIAQLREELDLQKSMVDRLRLALARGDDYR